MIYYKIASLCLALLAISCGFSKKDKTSKEASYKYLALGDSYTIGESVCENCNFPKQLTDSLNKVSKLKTTVKIIAKTGWTSTDLLSAIVTENPSKDYDLVTLLIGVNNQYQGKPFSLYEEEFPKLLDMAIDIANGKAENVLVLSIPDYGFTPFGSKSGKSDKITADLNKYNRFAEDIASKKGVHFENITPITQQGLNNQALVASDELHPSKLAYRMFVEKVFEKALAIIH